MAAQKRKKKLLTEMFGIFERLLAQKPRFTTLLILPDHKKNC